MHYSGSLRRLGVAITVAACVIAAVACGSPVRPGGEPGSAGVRVDGEHRIDDRVVDLVLRSPSLGADAAVRLITPRGWKDRAPDRKWPVLYLLPGGDGDHTGWTADTDVVNLPQLRDVLVVVPGMPMFGFYTDWHDGTPAVESFHLDEMLPLLERDYGAGDRRVIAGVSQGGYGALAYTARRPGLFRAAASYSGWLHPLRRADIVLGAAGLVGVDDGTRIWGDPIRDRTTWEAHDPYYLAEKLTGVPVFLSSGDGTPGELDPPGLRRESLFDEIDRRAPEFPGAVDLTEAVMHESTRAVADRLQRLGAQPVTHLTSGTHSPPYWQRELHRSLPLLLDAL
ncbi:alpha/beta hydrolase [Nocardia wallacei]|uniref:alpha/beta hydrolase n=1 Tax=Nocardia wallacei TaxID=480035 RepID=UPI002453813E|nr:alpha/beta hydrolase family protein [Nocardia wallacei]